MPDVVRVAKEPVSVAKELAPEPKDPGLVMEATAESPIALHQEIEGVPFTAKYFDIAGIWDNPDVGYRDDVELIERVYREKVASSEIEDGKSTYEAFIKEAEKATNTKNAPASVKVAKIAEWLKFMGRMDEIDRQRRKYAN